MKIHVKIAGALLLLTLGQQTSFAFYVEADPYDPGIAYVDAVKERDSNYESAEDAVMDEEEEMETIREYPAAKWKHRRLTRIN